MIYGSLCSGIEAATVAWDPLGWSPAFFSEIKPFPSSVLDHHYPDVSNYGDMTEYERWKRTIINLLVAGTPCQTYSVAGLRAGLDDPRGDLMLTFGAVADQYRPQWICWENVPGVLSSNEGRDFGTFLGMLAEIGYGFAYRVLNAQYFGVPQRRRRVFVVGYFGDWRPPAAVLFERHSLSGDIAPSTGKGKDIAGTLDAGFGRRRGSGMNPNQIVADPGGEDLSHALSARDAKGPCSNLAQGTLVCHGTQDPLVSDNAFPLGTNKGQENAVFGIPGNWVGRKPENGGNQVEPCYDESPCLTKTDRHAVAIQENQRAEVRLTESAPSLAAGGGKPGQGYEAVLNRSQVRRLTPIECERLQGFEDNYTRIPYRNKSAEECPDGPRYEALGNSMPVPVMRWIGSRIDMVDKILRKAA